MREELRDELNELLRDGQAWIATISISLPSIIGFLLLVQGNPNVFLVGLWVFILLSVISISIYILFAKKKEQGIYIPLPNGGQIERSVTKYRLLQPYARGSIASSIVVAVILMGVPPLNRPFREVIVGTLTPTLTQTPTQTQTLTLIPSSTVTLSPTSTITLSPTYPPAMSEFLYYMIVLDSSVNMSESFDNRSKWDAALESLNIILDGLNENASYGLVVVGGSGSRSALNPCREPSRLQMSFASREGVRDQINELQPGGGGSFYNGFTLAKNHLENLAIDKIRTLIYITGSNDTCEERDEWGDLERIIPFIDGINVHGEIIILDETNGLQTQDIAERLDSLSAKVNVQAPQSIPALQQSYITVINNVTVYVNTEIEAIGTDTSAGSGPISTPAPRPTNPPVILPPTQVIVIPDPPTAIPPTAIPPTFPATLPPHVLSVLPSQADVFSQTCFLRNQARVYAQFFQGQAGISAELVNSGRTNQMLGIDFSNVSYEGANYAGWEVWLGPDEDSGIDLSESSPYSSLVFFIKGQNGGEEPNVYLMMPILNDYQRFWKDVEQVKVVGTAWKKIVIPLSHFASSQEPHQQVDLNNIQRIQFLFEWYPEPRSGRIFIDDLCVE